MKVLSVRQPWAWAIIHAGKDIENRDWPTRVRGRVAIHASKGGCTVSTDVMLALAPAGLRKVFVERGALVAGEFLARGAIIGTVEIVDCVTFSESRWFVGEFGFVLRDPRPLAEPIPWKGALGFRDLPGDIVRRLA